MKAALYFGTFDPIHIYHEAIINHLLEHEQMDKVLIVVSPQSPHKAEGTSFVDRALMAVAATKKYGDKIKVSPIEQNMPRPSYTIDTLKQFKKHYDYEFSIVMGFDNWIKIKTWKAWKTIVSKYPILVIPRGNETDAEEEFNKYLNILNLQGVNVNEGTHLIKGLPQNQISSTFIRNEIKAEFGVAPYLNEDVYTYIKSKNFYK